VQFFGLSCTTQIRLSQRSRIVPKPWKLLTFSNSFGFGCKPFCLCTIPHKKAFVGHDLVFVSIPCFNCVVFPLAGQERETLQMLIWELTWGREEERETLKMTPQIEKYVRAHRPFKHWRQSTKSHSSVEKWAL